MWAQHVRGHAALRRVPFRMRRFMSWMHGHAGGVRYSTSRLPTAIGVLTAGSALARIVEHQHTVMYNCGGSVDVVGVVCAPCSSYSEATNTPTQYHDLCAT
jgi:hypothetical protein